VTGPANIALSCATMARARSTQDGRCCLDLCHGGVSTRCPGRPALSPWVARRELVRIKLVAVLQQSFSSWIVWNLYFVDEMLSSTYEKVYFFCFLLPP
jgi:hypothetical protein